MHMIAKKNSRLNAISMVFVSKVLLLGMSGLDILTEKS